MEHGADVVVKIDGDGQMEPKHFRRLVLPVVTNQADYAKGNRFQSGKYLQAMPFV